MDNIYNMTTLKQLCKHETKIKIPKIKKIMKMKIQKYS